MHVPDDDDDDGEDGGGAGVEEADDYDAGVGTGYAAVH